MITDALLLLSDAQADIRNAATYVSTNTVDLGVTKRDQGVGERLFVLFTVDVAFAGGTAVYAQIITSAAANLGSPTVLATSPTFADATLVAGFNFYMPIPPRPLATTAAQRYLGVQYVGTGTHSAGSISARIVKDVTDLTYFPSGFSTL